MDNPAFIATVIGANVSLTGVLLTLVYNLLHKRAEDRRHQRQMALEERRAELDKNQLAVELYNQREIRLFEARITHYPSLYEALMPLASREISNLTAENAVEVEERLKEVGYTVVSSCLSASSSERLAALRDSLAQFAKGDVEGEEISRRRIELFQALHRDLDRGDHYYLGPYDPQILEDLRMHRSIQE